MLQMRGQLEVRVIATESEPAEVEEKMSDCKTDDVNVA